MLSLIWISPVLAFVIALATGRLAALPAAIVALALAIAVVLSAGPQPVSAADIATTLIGGAWIALPAVVVIIAGLFFTEATAGLATASGPAAPDDVSRQIGTVCLFAGPFVETATGFGVGFVVALHIILRFDLPIAPAIVLAAFTQVLVPWGALGVGTTISAALVGVPVTELASRAAQIIAPVLVVLVFLYWRVALSAGIRIPLTQKIEDLALMALLVVLLCVTSISLPIELAGLCALGPVLLVRLWRQAGADLVKPAALATAAPYIALVALLALTRLVEPINAALSIVRLTPGDGAPYFAPFLSPAIPLLVIALIAGTLNRHRSLTRAAASTAAKSWRAALLTILLVALAWLLVRSGIAAALAATLENATGTIAVAIVPLLGALGGYLTGSNTGAGALSMPIASAFTDQPARLAWIAAAAVVAGSLMTALSPVRLVMGQAISGARDRDLRAAIVHLMPYTGVSLAVTLAAVLLVWN